MNEKEHSAEWSLTAELAKSNKRFFIAFIVTLCLWFATVAGFIWFLHQFEFESYQQDGEGVNIIGDTNEVQQYGAEN